MIYSKNLGSPFVSKDLHLKSIARIAQPNRGATSQRVSTGNNVPCLPMFSRDFMYYYCAFKALGLRPATWTRHRPEIIKQCQNQTTIWKTRTARYIWPAQLDSPIKHPKKNIQIIITNAVMKLKINISCFLTKVDSPIIIVTGKFR